jgi:cold-inducible RNA-binding protein
MPAKLGASYQSAPSSLASPVSSTVRSLCLKNIFVGNLSFTSTEDSVRSIFEGYGTVDRVSIITDRETGKSRGFAFVEMPNDDEANRAITALNGADFGGRKLNVNEARPREERGSGGGGFNRGGGGGAGAGGGGFRRREPRW